ncbi:hypothetical protein DSO57_1005828 [Entomophthora muscae]|uniref:Uncharacterized protein n=1 Tax=Entomophthora muscae TaxID=34485 RepID=A0ACC2UHI0_9FUNG|nr:hypothetical protein DSO57_1005828 [Entomophthora muscae]
MQGNFFLFWFLASFLSVVLTLENPTPTTDWHNSSPDNSHQKESLVHGWFKYPSGHWGRKFHYGCASTSPPPVKPSLVRPYASFYLLTYVVGYYPLERFSSMLGRFAYLGHLAHLAMITVPIGSVIAGLNLGALAHQIGNLFPLKWAMVAAVLAWLRKVSTQDQQETIGVLINQFIQPALVHHQLALRSQN